MQLLSIRFVALYEVLGGLLGMWQALHPQLYADRSSVTFNLVAVALCSLSMICGVRLWDDENRSRRDSLLLQACQVPRLFVGHAQLAILIGIDVSVRFSGPMVSLWTTTGVSFVIRKAAADQALMIGVNLVAVTMIALLRVGRERSMVQLPRHYE